MKKYMNIEEILKRILEQIASIEVPLARGDCYWYRNKDFRTNSYLEKDN